MFKKASALSGQMFKKGSANLSSLSKNLGSAAKLASKVASVGKEALQSDIAKKIIATNPELQKGANLVNRGLNLAAHTSGALNQAAELTNQKNYPGVKQDVANAIQRVKDIKNTVESGLSFVH